MMRFTDPWRKVTCPFCNLEFHPGQTTIMSRVNPGTVLREAPRSPMRRTLGRIMGPALTSYKREFASRQCPRCSNLLPPNIEQVDQNITIAIIGDTFSGKGHFITSLIHQLQRIQFAERSFQVIAASQDIEDRYTNIYYRPLFIDRVQLQNTPQVADIVNPPLIYELTLGETPTRARMKFNLLIYDASGEDWAQQIVLMKYKSHILNAKGIIFLADPWAMPEFVDRLAHFLRPPAAAITGRLSSQVLGTIVQTYQIDNSDLAADEFPLPVAIALSKADLIPWLLTLGPEYGFLADPTVVRPPNPVDADIIDQWVRKLLIQLKEDSLLGLARNFGNTKFFAVSATGGHPDPQGTFPPIRPHRCLDPLFWIFRELNILD